MAAPPFGINVVSRSHVVLCRACSSTARRVAGTCPSCGTALAHPGFAIAAAAVGGERRLWRPRQLRRATAA
jgi:predicted amidophosphoribosyltransferase